MKILVTGGTGFIGKKIIEFLDNSSNETLLLTRSTSNLYYQKVKTLYCDLNNIAESESHIIKFKPDILVHLAWENIPDYSEYTSKKNYSNSINFIKFIIKKTKCFKIIISGSCLEYNDGKIIGECKEDLDVKPVNPFGYYKYKIYEETKKLAKEKGLIINWLRLFYVYGPGQRKNSIIPTITNCIKDNKKLEINQPFNKNDFIYVDDVKKIITQFIKYEFASGIYNIGSGSATEIIQLVKIIEKILLNNETITNKMMLNSRKADTKLNFYANIEKIRNKINNLSITSLEEGVKKSIF